MGNRKNKPGLKGGLDLYQRKEPAFSREQRALLTPKYVYIPMEKDSNVKIASSFLDKPRFMQFVWLDYPGVAHNNFGKYKIELTEEEAEAQIAQFEGPKPLMTEELDFDDLVHIARRSLIVDETDGEPIFRKLQTFKNEGIKIIVADAIDEEPYVSSSVNTLLQKGDKIMDALRHIGKVLNTEQLYAVYYADLDDTRTVIPGHIEGIEVKKVSGKYPIRARLDDKIEKQMGDGNYGLIGVQALLHLYRAIYFGKRQNTTIVTVAGDCVNYSCNVEVTVGTSIRELLEFVGLSRDPARVIIRGSMCGVSLTDLDLPILHSEKAVLAFEDEIRNHKLPCINCGNCIDVCPARLKPNYLYKYNKIGDKNGVNKLHPEDCIECGCCSYVCPARLELSAAIAIMKERVLYEVEDAESAAAEKAAAEAAEIPNIVAGAEIADETIREGGEA